MDASTLRLGFLVGVIGLIFLLLWRDRENVERAGILFYRRTKNGINTIDRIAKRFPRFWNMYAWGGVLAAVVSVPVMLYSVAGMVESAVLAGKPAEGAGLVYPSTGSTVSQSPGAIGVPAEYWFISIAILMVVHELSHGIVARCQDFEINSVGVLVLGIIPGAFVEPKGENMLPGGDDADRDESGEHHGAWDQGNWLSRVKVLSAGSWANYITAGLFVLFAIGLSGAVTHSNGLMYQAQEDYPAYQAGLGNGTLQMVDNHTITGVQDVRKATAELQPGDSARLVTTEGNFTVTAAEREGFEGGYLGLQFTQVDIEYNQGFRSYSGVLSWFIGLFQIVGFLNLGIGLFNMLPAKPLDGGHILDAVVERFAGEEYRKYVNTWSAILILTLIGVLAFSILA
jgi:hypothetical protein